MTTKYFALLTHQGAARLANAAALGNPVQITHLAVGDGGGTLPTPDPAQTALISEKRRAALNALTIDAANRSQIIAEQIIPESEGGFWIREIGLFDADGVMIAVANCAETYKPQLQEGSGRTQTVRMILIVNSTDAVTLKIDPSVVLATRQYVDDELLNALGNDADFAHTVMNKLDGKLAMDQNGADILDKQTFVDNLGLGDLALAGVATGVLAGTGHAELPMIVNGVKTSLIVQWGQLGMKEITPNVFNIQDFLFPIAFPTALLAISGSIRTGITPGGGVNYSFEGATNAGAKWHYTSSSSGLIPIVNYIAIGY
ncbi:phage tail protein [Lonsdalea quercina]|uniref:phage tail protein n=1 Tax=Lonsdalea quercina TaxID=71657 RepID=UPI0039751E4D